MNYTNVRYKIKKDSLSLIYFLLLVLICCTIVCMIASIMFWTRLDDIKKIPYLMSICKGNISMEEED